jgi:hypothetical protein
MAVVLEFSLASNSGQRWRDSSARLVVEAGSCHVSARCVGTLNRRRRAASRRVVVRRKRRREKWR